MAARKISAFTLGDRGTAMAPMNWHRCKPTAWQDRRVPSGPAWLAKPPSTNCRRWMAARRGRPGPGPSSAPRRSPRCSPDATLHLCCFVQGRLAFCLSFCLIHPRPGPFTSVRSDDVCAVRGRWRTPVNKGQHCWKACWGQPLRSSNLLSSATSDQAIHQSRS